MEKGDDERADRVVFSAFAMGLTVVFKKLHSDQ
jgi:hypothetical protein